jgi:hypothetical protein
MEVTSLRYLLQRVLLIIDLLMLGHPIINEYKSLSNSPNEEQMALKIGSQFEDSIPASPDFSQLISNLRCYFQISK